MMVEGLTELESQHVTALATRLTQYQLANAQKWAFYDSESAVKNIGIAIPESMVNVQAVLSWPETVVDAVEERIDWLGWYSVDGGEAIGGLNDVFQEAQLGLEFNKAKLDALVTGVGFISVTAGDIGSGEPRVIANAVSSQMATFEWDYRRKRVARAITMQSGEMGESISTLYTPDATVTHIKTSDGSVSVNRHVHNRGRCSLIVLQNRMRSGEKLGKSEITKAIRYYTEHGARTILGMEYNREIYTTPQRYFKNVDPEQLGFEETDSPFDLVQKGYKVAMNRAVILPPNPEGDSATPDTGQYTSAPPTPYIEELRMLSSLVASAAGVPVNYFGFQTDNPPSADAIRAMESRLLKKAERRLAIFGQVLRNDMAFVVKSIIDGVPPSPEWVGSIEVQWRDPSTPTRAASVDAAAKLAGSGMIAADDPILLEMAGFTPMQIKQIERHRTKSTTRALLEKVRERQLLPQPESKADGLVDRIE